MSIEFLLNIELSFNPTDRQEETNQPVLKTVKTKEVQAILANLHQAMQSLKQDSMYLKEDLPPDLEALTSPDVSLDTKRKTMITLRKMFLTCLDANIEMDTDPFEQWLKSKETELKAEPTLDFECLTLQEILWTAKNDRLNLQGCFERIIKKIDELKINAKAKTAYPAAIDQLFQKHHYAKIFRDNQNNTHTQKLTKIRNKIQKTEKELRTTEEKMQQIAKETEAKNNNISQLYQKHASLSQSLQYYKQKESLHTTHLANVNASTLLIPFPGDQSENASVRSLDAALNFLSENMRDHHSLSKKRKREESQIEERDLKKLKSNETVSSKTPDNQALDYLKKALELSGSERYLINGTLMDRQELLLNVISMNPSLAIAYHELAFLVPKGSTITLKDGTRMTEQALYFKCIELAPSSRAQLYCQLGDRLPQGEKITFNDGTTMTHQELYLNAIALNPSYYYPYYLLGNTLLSGEKITFYDGTSKTSQDLYLKSIELNPGDAFPYLSLANTLASFSESISLLDGTLMTQKELYLKAIAINPSLAEPYFHLGLHLPKGEKITLQNGTTMTQQELFIKIIKSGRSPFLAKAYFHLGTTLSAEESIQIDEFAWTQKQLFNTSESIDKSLH